MDRRRVQFVAAQLGRKPGKKQALARLLIGDDLPGGAWRVMDQRTWRTGKIGPPTPWGRRASQAGSVTAWRSFRDTRSARWAWIQAAPMASAEDAKSALTGAGQRGLANLHANARSVNEAVVTVEPFVGASAVWACEQRTEDRDGPEVVLMLAAAVGEWFIVMCLAGSPAWDWPSATQLAALQAQRLSA